MIDETRVLGSHASSFRILAIARGDYGIQSAVHEAQTEEKLDAIRNYRASRVFGLLRAHTTQPPRDHQRNANENMCSKLFDPQIADTLSLTAN